MYNCTHLQLLPSCWDQHCLFHGTFCSLSSPELQATPGCAGGRGLLCTLPTWQCQNFGRMANLWESNQIPALHFTYEGSALSLTVCALLMFAKKHPTFHYLVPQAPFSLMLRLGTLKPSLGGKNHLFPYMPLPPPGRGCTLISMHSRPRCSRRREHLWAPGRSVKFTYRWSPWSCPLADLGWDPRPSLCSAFEVFFSSALPDFRAMCTHRIPSPGTWDPWGQSTQCMGYSRRIRGTPSSAPPSTGWSQGCICTYIHRLRDTHASPTYREESLQTLVADQGRTKVISPTRWGSLGFTR